ILTARSGLLEGFLELRETGPRSARRALSPPALEEHSRLCAAERLRLVEQRVALLAAATQALDSRELCQYLRAADVRRLLFELSTKTSLARVEVAEVPQRTKPVPHRPATIAARKVSAHASPQMTSR